MILLWILEQNMKLVSMIDIDAFADQITQRNRLSDHFLAVSIEWFFIL